MYILNIARTIKKDVCQQNQRLYLCKTMIKNTHLFLLANKLKEKISDP